MPRIDDNKNPSKSKFKKRRAWNFLESLDNNNLETNAKRNDNDLKSNYKQNENKTIIINNQPDNKIKTKSKLIKNELETALNQNNNNLETKLKHNNKDLKSNYKQNDNILETALESIENLKKLARGYQGNLTSYDNLDPKCQVLSLSGIQEITFFKCLLSCQANNSSSTGPINTVNFFKDLNISLDVGRTSLSRLIQKGLIKREKGKKGQNGFCLISLPPNVLEACKLLFKNNM